MKINFSAKAILLSRGKASSVSSLLLVCCLLWQSFHNLGFAEPVQQNQILKTGIRFDQLTLEQSIQLALQNYPSLRSARARIGAAEAGVDLSKTVYLPSLNIATQLTRGTRNNIAGIFLPQNPMFPISGPVIDNPSFGTAWGSALGGLLSWEPFDFGFRKANVDAANAQVEQATANVRVAEFQLASTVADTYLRVLAAKQAVAIAQANIERTKVFVDTVQVLAKSGLRPGVDYSRAVAELASSCTQRAKAKETEAVALAYLSQLMGMAGQSVDIQGSFITTQFTETETPKLTLDVHPVLSLQKTSIELVQAREKSLARSYYPKFQVHLGAYGRGSGVDNDGSLEGAANGLYPTRGNLVAGVTTTFSLFDLPAIRAQQRREQFNEEAEQARYDELVQEITGRFSQANASYLAALEIARQTPVQLEAARLSELQTRARYKAGLATVVDVADTQRVLTQAEVEDTLARVGIWRALLQQSVTQGNLKPYVDLTKLQEGQ